MVYGIGCDLCSIARMEKSLLGPHGAVFARRVFGPAEQAALGLPLAEEEGTARRTAHTVASAAADFAAKEAFLKAAGTGLREPFSLCEIEAVRLPGGAPAYHFSGYRFFPHFRRTEHSLRFCGIFYKDNTTLQTIFKYSV